ncbi:MAG: Nramp family divalent metal transporter [Balneolaceae bacterium]|nr:Nramp family divalent metal transporter [Balneolaceae bacterium]
MDESIYKGADEKEKPKTLSRKVILALSAVGPGLFLIGYNIGTGSITTMAMAGAQYSMTLLWALLLSGIFTYVLMVAYGHLALVTGNTALYNFKTQIPKVGKLIAFYCLLAMIFTELLALSSIMGIVSELLQEGARLTVAPESSEHVIDTVWIISVLTLLIFSALWFGKYKFFERILTGFVLLLVFCFVVVFFMVSPSYSEIFTGMVPGIPDEPGAYRIVAAMAGTTCSAVVFLMRSIIVSEKGWDITHLKHEKRDAMVSVSVMVFLSAVVMAVGAGTLHVMGLTMENTIEMIQLLEPIGGEVAAFILIIGVAGAGLSTMFPIALIAPWLIADYLGWERDLKSPLFRFCIVTGLLFAFGSVFLEQTPPVLMVVAMALMAFILPAVAFPIYYLLNKKELMREEKYMPSRLWNFGLISVIIFSLVTSYFAIRGFM